MGVQIYGMQNQPRIVLASTSRYRQGLLRRLGLTFEAHRPPCDESYDPKLSPDEVAKTLAVRKARSVADALVAGCAGTGGAGGVGRAGQTCLIIGSDQVVDLDGAILGKPGGHDAALHQLQRMTGRRHRLITAVALLRLPEETVGVEVDVHALTMLPLKRPALDAYLRYDTPYDCAGSYKLESRGVALFERIEADPDTADDSAIIGLPLMKLCRLLRGAGFDPLLAGEVTA